MKAWTGKNIAPIGLNRKDVEIEDIAHALSNTCRYGGHSCFYTVAEHCVLMARYALKAGHSNRIALLALLHDAAEAYLGDIPRPLKKELTGFEDHEAGTLTTIYEALIIRPPNAFEWESIKNIDDRIIADECAAVWSPEQYKNFDWPHFALGIRIFCWYPRRAKEEFLKMFEELRTKEPYHAR